MNTSGLLQNFARDPKYSWFHEHSKNWINYLYLHFILSVKYQFSISPNLDGFPDILNFIRNNVGFGIAKMPTAWRYVFNIMQTSVNKQRYWMDLTLARSNGAYVGEGMNHIWNVKVHLKTRSQNVNIYNLTRLWKMEFISYIRTKKK